MARKTVTAEEACDILTIPFGSWRARMWAYHKGVPSKGKREDPERERRVGPWMPTPLKGGYSGKKSTFKWSDIQHLGFEWYGPSWGTQETEEEARLPVDPKVEAACRIFGVPAPEHAADPIDVTNVRRVFRKAVAGIHPDQHMADPKAREHAEQRTVGLTKHLQAIVEHNNRIET